MSDSMYILIYEVNGKTIAACCSANYAYVKRKKEVYNKALGKNGQIKKLRKSQEKP